jgi:hypothetical protein
MSLDAFVLIAAVTLLALAAGISLAAYRRHRGPRVVVCPADGRPAAVTIDAPHAALAAVTGGAPRLAACSFWPGRGRCGQTCVDQAGPSPETAGLVRLLERWLAGRRCTHCGGELAPPRWCEHPPTLLDARGRSRPWFEMAAAEVVVGLAADEYRPLCWRCHVLEGLQRNPHPVPARRPQMGSIAPPT